MSINIVPVLPKLSSRVFCVVSNAHSDKQDEFSATMDTM